MNSNIHILLTITAAATSSFLQTPSNQLESTFNSTFLAENEKLFKPIIIPNITKFPEAPHKTQKANEIILKRILQQEDSSQESSQEDLKTTGNPLKFSSRYSTAKHNGLSEDRIIEDFVSTQIPSQAESSKSEETPKVISNRVDTIDSEEENRKDYTEESEEVEPTTESPSTTSNRKYLDKDSEEISTTEVTSEEKEEEDKRSVEDYYNSGSKNYHSIQTPLNRIKYQGPHFFRDERERIVTPIVRRPATHNWPYSKSQLKKELENSNEISNSDENYEEKLDEGISEEVKTRPKQSELESAEEKDREKFDRSKKYNYIELRNQRKQKQKALIAEEEKDDQKPLFQSLRQYQVDEKEPTHQPIEKQFFNYKNNEIWSTKHPPITTPKNNFRTPPIKKPKIHSETEHFQGHQFLGPVVFSHNLDFQKNKPPQKEPHRNVFLKGLIESEKLDLTNQRSQKSVIRTGSKESQSFNHLKESDEMYNAILANIQSVFGLRTQPLKSGGRSQKGSEPEVDLDESRALTWSLPLIKAN